MENKCKECYENDKTPDENDCKKCQKVIIDDVDVSGCEHINCCCYENGKCLWTKRYYENNIVPDCEKVKNCYYKQLKRLEQKLEKIKEAITTCLTFHTCQKCKFYKECEMGLEEFILKVIRGAER